MLDANYDSRRVTSPKVEYKPNAAYDLLFKALDPQKYGSAMDTLRGYLGDKRFVKALENDIFRNTLDNFLNKLLVDINLYHEEHLQVDKPLRLYFQTPNDRRNQHTWKEGGYSYLDIGKIQLERYSSGVARLLESYRSTPSRKFHNVDEAMNVALAVMGAKPFNDVNAIHELIKWGARENIPDIDFLRMKNRLQQPGLDKGITVIPKPIHTQASPAISV